MYELEIETRKHLRKVRNPRKARAIDLGVWSIIKVMDEDGKWHFVGQTMFLADAQEATEEINKAIKEKRNSILIEDYIS